MTENTVCPNCSRPLLEGNPYCPWCGQHVGGSPDKQTLQNTPHSVYGSYHDPPSSPTPTFVEQRKSKRRVIFILLVAALVIIGSVLGLVGYSFIHSNPLDATRVPGPTAAARSATPEQIYKTATSGTSEFYPLVAQDSNLTLDDYPTDPAIGCSFKQGAYHLWISKIGNYVYCIAKATNFSNFALDVEVNLIKGDGAMLLMRCTPTDPQGYRYTLTTTYYDLVIDDSSNGTPIGTIRLVGNSGNIISVNKPFLLSVVAQGNMFYLYKDHVFLGQGTDNRSIGGQLGFGVYSPSHPTEVAFSNLKVWKLA